MPLPGFLLYLAALVGWDATSRNARRNPLIYKALGGVPKLARCG
jgi:hypothetical protein